MLTILAAILALSISSDKIDTFMHLPDWFPTSVDAEHTFGSDDRTNCTHRTTLDTLASVESVFDAYHERVFYASEGRSNDWNRAVYGPRPTDLQRLWFTNAESAASCFVYSTWTNDWPRATPDSRRLLEFNNVFGLARCIQPLFERRSETTPWLDKGVTWGVDRDIMFGSSWGPTNSTLPSIEWTENASFCPDLSSSCVPLCYCATDSVFHTLSPSADGFLYDLLKGLDSHFNALYRIEGGPQPEYPVSTNGWLAEWHNSGAWTNSLAAKTSVPGIITNHFPLAGPEYAMTNHTRRLVPDDYELPSYTVETNGLTEVLHERVQVKVSQSRFGSPYWRDGDEPLDPKYGVHVGFSAGGAFYYGNGSVSVHSFWREFSFADPYTGSEVSSRGQALIVGPRSFPVGREPDVIKLVFDGPRETTIDYDTLERSMDIQGWFSRYVAYLTKTNFTFTLVASNVVVKTNYTHASSILATESRALAMLDRTYEIPKCVVPTNIPMSSAERDTTRELRSSLQASESIEVSLQLEYPFTPLREPIDILDILCGEYEQKNSTSNSYSQLSNPTVVRRRLFGLSESAYGGFTVVPSGGLPRTDYIVGNLREFLSDMYGRQTWMHGNLYRITSVLSYDDGFGTGYVLVCDDCTGENVDYMHAFDLSGLVPESPVTLRIGASITVDRSATVFISGIPSLLTFDRMYPWYGPGPYGYSNGTVGKSRVMFAEEVLSFASYFVDFEWTTTPISLPSPRFHVEINNPMYGWNSWHRIAVSPQTAGLGSGLHTRVYQEMSGSLQSKVDAEFRAEVGDYSTASTLVPASLDVVYADKRLVGIDVFARGDTIMNDMTFVVNGPHPADVSIRDADGEFPDKMPIVGWSLSLSAASVGDVYFNSANEKRPVAVDGRLSPVVVTDWNWKSLKSERNNQ